MPTQAFLDRLERIKKLHADGLTNKQIAERLGITAKQVGVLVRKLDLTPNKEYSPDIRFK